VDPCTQFITPATRHVDWKKFREDTPSSPEVIEPNTLNFWPNFKFSRLKFFWGTPLPVPVCASKAWSSAEGARGFGGENKKHHEHFIRPPVTPYGRPKHHEQNRRPPVLPNGRPNNYIHRCRISHVASLGMENARVVSLTVNNERLYADQFLITWAHQRATPSFNTSYQYASCDHYIR